MRKRIGDFLIEKGLITETQIEEIVKHSKRTGLKFGEAAIELGLVKRDDLIRLFGPNFSIDFFHLEPQYFPPQTMDLIPRDVMLKYGVLPLGIKTEYRFFKARKYLNVGFLNPARQEALDAVETATREKFVENTICGVKIYLVLADQFIDVLTRVYQMNERDLRSKPIESIDETLQMFLESPAEEGL